MQGDIGNNIEMRIAKLEQIMIVDVGREQPRMMA